MAGDGKEIVTTEFKQWKIDHGSVSGNAEGKYAE